jgi:ribose 5-phosphate isomerase A
MTIGKQLAARAALSYVLDGAVLGVGTGSTVDLFIDALAESGRTVAAAVSSSGRTTERLTKLGINVVSLNDVESLPVYIDGADEVDPAKRLIKGGGAALTREKIVAEAAEIFVCIVDPTKQVDVLGRFPLPIEVIPMARNSVATHLAQVTGGDPVWREGIVTDNANDILDVHGLTITDPAQLETDLNQIPGVVTVGLFARRPADVVIVGQEPPIVL